MSPTFEVEADARSAASWPTGEAFGDYEGFFDEGDLEALGVDPHRPTEAKPGSAGKVQMLAARYAAGLPLWHDSDCYDHGPDEIEDEDE